VSETSVTIDVVENTIDITEGQNTVVVSQVENTINVSAPGPQGPQGATGAQGPAGSSFATYTHTQSSAASTWVIVHNLGCRPSVTIVDSGGNVQIGEVLYDSGNQVTVTFAAAFGGYAYLN
jgi:hypothetical protein